MINRLINQFLPGDYRCHRCFREIKNTTIKDVTNWMLRLRSHLVDGVLRLPGTRYRRVACNYNYKIGSRIVYGYFNQAGWYPVVSRVIATGNVDTATDFFPLSKTRERYGTWACFVVILKIITRRYTENIREDNSEFFLTRCEIQEEPACHDLSIPFGKILFRREDIVVEGICCDKRTDGFVSKICWRGMYSGFEICLLWFFS